MNFNVWGFNFLINEFIKKDKAKTQKLKQPTINCEFIIDKNKVIIDNVARTINSILPNLSSFNFLTIATEFMYYLDITTLLGRIIVMPV